MKRSIKKVAVQHDAHLYARVLFPRTKLVFNPIATVSLSYNALLIFFFLCVCVTLLQISCFCSRKKKKNDTEWK